MLRAAPWVEILWRRRLMLRVSRQELVLASFSA